MVYQEDAVRTAQRLELGSLAQQPYLLNRDLAQRPFRGESGEIRMSGEEQWIIDALFRGPLLALLDDLQVFRQAQIVMLDLCRIAQQNCSETPRQGSFANSLRAAQKYGLGNTLLSDHLGQRIR